MSKLSGVAKWRRKLQKTYIKMLRAYARGLIEKGGALEDKSIRLELKLREEIKNKGAEK